VIVFFSVAVFFLAVGFLLGVPYGAHIVAVQGRIKDHISEEIGRLRQDLKRQQETFQKKF